MLDRQGRVSLVIVGDTGSIYIPELPRARTGAGRLRGLRLLHTHLTDSLLSQEDLMDMLFLRLDDVGVLTVDQHGGPASFQHAHLLPGGTQPYMVHDPQGWDRVITDFTAQAQALEEELSRITADARETGSESGRAVLVSVSPDPRSVQESSLAELAELADTAGLTVAGTMVQRVRQLNYKFILGKGKLAELEVLALTANAGVILFDGELSPAQLHNLADITERKVIDRTQLILDIFAQRASTRAGKLQVELAQLQYTQPRLTGKNRAMDRLAGGIGGRGPGETKLETDRRKVRERIARIKQDLKALRTQRGFTRGRRAKARVPVASLVGYTNAGKSTLLNTLTNADVLAEDKLFATLDTTTRRLRFPQERELIVTDTVGFIRSLPKELKEAFRATLEELEAADLLLHVADAGHPELEMQLRAVEEILDELELQDIPRLLVLNKWETLDDETRLALAALYPAAIRVSARTRLGLDDLTAEIIRRIDWERML
ncbi:GTP-binding proten HflX [Oleidesulfovibrio alaskensis G20]|jgi:GTP-binding protein HflX|uniref:GTPase HflX n=1 Tax=Oleidesulfovibrio alaskensis (strain ATCC BAA-1058 / DSM 17464 / G20) TaxID=207559 RepID=Q316G9_OLEA2|nr:GTP-binding proten HflX [Oleidesulfovibrio alaskensis G20]